MLEGLLPLSGYARFFVTLTAVLDPFFAAILACILAVCALTWITLRLAAPIGAKLGTTGLNIATRLLGLLLAALAIQTMAEGLRQLFPGLA